MQRHRKVVLKQWVAIALILCGATVVGLLIIGLLFIKV
jgi:hypothetical protein